MELTVIPLSPLIALIAGVLILVMPRLLNYIVAIYLIVVGLLGLFPHIRRLTQRRPQFDAKALRPRRPQGCVPKTLRDGLAQVALLLAIGLFSQDAAAADGLSLSSLVDRDEPSAAAAADGMRDYIAMINARDGGVNGICRRLSGMRQRRFPEKPVQCLRRRQGVRHRRRGMVATTALALLPASGRDGIPLLAPAGGPAMVADGRYFPWAFAMPATGLDAAQAILDAIAGKPAALNGKTIALLRIDAPESADALAFFQGRSTPLGFRLLDLPVPRKELQTQAAAWTEIGSAKPDYVGDRRPGRHERGSAWRGRKGPFPDEPRDRHVRGRRARPSLPRSATPQRDTGCCRGTCLPLRPRCSPTSPLRLPAPAVVPTRAPRAAAAPQSGPRFSISAASSSERSPSKRCGLRSRISTGAISTRPSSAGRWST